MKDTRKSWFTIVIANYNGERYLPTCLESVACSTYKKYEVLIVDDCSTDKSISIIKGFQKKYPHFHLLQNDVNMGPSGSRNAALAQITTEFVYFLDNDTEVQPTWLSEVERIFRKHNKSGAVQSLLCDFDDRTRIQNAGLKLIPQTGWAVGLLENESITKRKNAPEQVVGLSAALAVRMEVFKKGVSFDKAFFHYSEDLDFSWRIWIAGYKIFLAPNSIVYHKVKKMEERKNVGANKEVIYFHLAKNSLRALTKNYQLTNFWWYFPQCVVILISRALLVLILRQDSSSLKGTLRAFWWYVANLADTLTERKHVQTVLRRAPDKTFISTIMVKESVVDIYKKYFSQTKLLPF